MHRISLKLDNPTSMWYRSTPEHVLFAKTLNDYNLRDMEVIFSILDQEMQGHIESFNFVEAQKILSDTERLLKSGYQHTTLEGASPITALILRIPKNSPILQSAIKLRGSYYFHNGYFECAINDFEMFLYNHAVPNAYEELFEVYGVLVLSCYLMGQYKKAQSYLQLYKRCKKNVTPRFRSQALREKLDRHIVEFMDELYFTEDLAPEFLKEIKLSFPFKGFNNIKDIPLSSKACIFNKEIPGVFSNCVIPKNSVILVEDPIIRNVTTPFLQCEVCLQSKQGQVFACFKCRYKIYCSLGCMRKDYDLHKIECCGYKNLTLFVLDACGLFRIFIQISILLRDNVFTLPQFRQITTVAKMLEELDVMIDNNDFCRMRSLRLLKSKPSYGQLTNSQYAHLITVAYRLTMFCSMKLFVIDSIYGSLKIPHHEKLILIGVILMRIYCHLIIHTFDIEFTIPEQSTSHLPLEQQIKDILNNIIPTCRNLNNDRGYDTNPTNCGVEQQLYMQRKESNDFCSFESMENYASTKCRITEYKDRIAIELLLFNKNVEEIYTTDGKGSETEKFISNTIINLTDDERSHFYRDFVRVFHNNFVPYFLNKSTSQTRTTQILTVLCSTLHKLRHSCDPNTIYMILEDGIVVGKTLRDIKKGEELFVSYKAHYMKHNRKIRKNILNVHCNECFCKYCEMPEAEEPHNICMGIVCKNCNKNITPTNKKCSKCGNSYNDLLKKNLKEVRELEAAINIPANIDVGECGLYILHFSYYMQATDLFLPSHKISIKAHLKFAKFLALKNLAAQAYGIVKQVQRNILSRYKESMIWFSLYADILQIIKIILYYNLTERSFGITNRDLMQMCDLGLRILKGQLDSIRFLELFDTESKQILSDLETFYSWDNQIVNYNIITLINRSKILSKAQSKCKDNAEFIPI